MFDATFTEPEGASEVKYFLYNDTFAEMQFVLAETNTVCTARLQPLDDFTDISGSYYTWTVVDGDFGISNYQTELSEAEDEEGNQIQKYLWFAGMDGMMYSLTVSNKDLAGFDITAIAIQLMGDDYFDPNVDYTGHYEDGDFDTVDVTSEEDGTYKVEIGITRLTTLEAAGLNVDGAMEFSCEAPDGSPLNGVFFQDGDTYTLTITRSTWELLPQDSSFEGFAYIQ